MSKKSKLETIEWYEESSKGEQTGLEVDLKKGKIITANGRTLPIEDHIKDVVWVIENNLKSLREKRDRFQYKMNVTETVREPIKNGYKLIEPLTETQMTKYEERVKEMSEQIDELVILKSEYKK